MAWSIKNPFSRGRLVIPVVRLSGAIGMQSPLRSGLSASSAEPLLKKAFAYKSAPAVGILVNSPGGAAVQSHLIHKLIRDLAEEKEKKVIVGVEDVAASGGYMIACAGDEIVVNRSSVVGSIGVIYAGFGFQKLIEKIGVERRVHTAGANKSILDPFRPEQEADVERLKALQADIHDAFIKLVQSRRAKLAEDPELFTGAFWSGPKAIELGLADTVGDLRSVLRKTYGDKVELRTIAEQRGLLRRRLGMAGGLSVSAQLDGIRGAVEERLLWERYGL